jgi:hypothetical protein
VRAKRPKRPISNRRQIAGADRGTRDYVAACRALGRAPDAELAVVAQDSILRCSCACDKATFQRAIQ